MLHIVSSCPQNKQEAGLQQFHLADNAAVKWLTWYSLRMHMKMTATTVAGAVTFVRLCSTNTSSLTSSDETLLRSHVTSSSSTSASAAPRLTCRALNTSHTLLQYSSNGLYSRKNLASQHQKDKPFINITHGTLMTAHSLCHFQQNVARGTSAN